MSIKSIKVATKKVVKKATAKKTLPATNSKVTKKAAAKKSLVYAKNEHSFWTKDGQILNSLVALNNALVKMDKSVFNHHVVKDRNDFAVWVDVVLCDQACAQDLAKAKTASSAAKIVAKHLKTYQG